MRNKSPRRNSVRFFSWETFDICRLQNLAVDIGDLKRENTGEYRSPSIHKLTNNNS